MSLFPQRRVIPKRFYAGDGNYSEGDKLHKITVPDGKLWQITSAVMNTIDSATRQISVKRPVGQNDEMQRVLFQSAGTGLIFGPSVQTAFAYSSQPILVFENEVIEFKWGTSQTTGGDYLSLTVLEYDLEEIFKK